MLYVSVFLNPETIYNGNDLSPSLTDIVIFVFSFSSFPSKHVC